MKILMFFENIYKIIFKFFNSLKMAKTMNSLKHRCSVCGNKEIPQLMTSLTYIEENDETKITMTFKCTNCGKKITTETWFDGKPTSEDLKIAEINTNEEYNKEA